MLFFHCLLSHINTFCRIFAVFCPNLIVLCPTLTKFCWVFLAPILPESNPENSNPSSYKKVNIINILGVLFAGRRFGPSWWPKEWLHRRFSPRQIYGRWQWSHEKMQMWRQFWISRQSWWQLCWNVYGDVFVLHKSHASHFWAAGENLQRERSQECPRSPGKMGIPQRRGHSSASGTFINWMDTILGSFFNIWAISDQLSITIPGNFFLINLKYFLLLLAKFL